MDNIFNYPNPFRNNTNFTFYAINDDNSEVDVKITIFSKSGKEIKTINKPIINGSFNTIFWDGKDNYSNLIANGTYFYNIQIYKNNINKFDYISKITKIK